MDNSERQMGALFSARVGVNLSALSLLQNPPFIPHTRGNDSFSHSDVCISTYFPHVHGGDSPPSSTKSSNILYFPHAWGWLTSNR